MADRHKPNMPGGYYLSPGNQELEQLSFRLPPSSVAKFNHTAETAGLTKRQAAELAIEILAREIETKLRRPPKHGPKPARPQQPKIVSTHG